MVYIFSKFLFIRNKGLKELDYTKVKSCIKNLQWCIMPHAVVRGTRFILYFFKFYLLLFCFLFIIIICVCVWGGGADLRRNWVELSYTPPPQKNKEKKKNHLFWPICKLYCGHSWLIFLILCFWFFLQFSWFLFQCLAVVQIKDFHTGWPQGVGMSLIKHSASKCSRDWLQLAVCKDIFPLCYSDMRSTSANNLLDKKVPVLVVMECKHASVIYVCMLIFFYSILLGQQNSQSVTLVRQYSDSYTVKTVLECKCFSKLIFAFA